MYDENQTFVLIDNCLKRSKFEPNAPSFKIDAKFFQASKSNWRKLIFFFGKRWMYKNGKLLSTHIEVRWNCRRFRIPSGGNQFSLNWFWRLFLPTWTFWTIFCFSKLVLDIYCKTKISAYNSVIFYSLSKWPFLKTLEACQFVWSS